jgi:hypothetical protein
MQVGQPFNMNNPNPIIASHMVKHNINKDNVISKKERSAMFQSIMKMLTRTSASNK